MERPATAPAKTTNKSGVSTEKRREYAENTKAKMTPEELERQRERDARKAQAYRDRQKSAGLSGRATMSAEKLVLIRKRNQINSLNYRNRLRGLPEVPMPPELKESFSALRTAAKSAPARFEVPTFKHIEIMDKTIPITNNTIEETYPSYKYSEFGFETKDQEERREQLERSAQHQTGKRRHVFMSPSAIVAQQAAKQPRTQSPTQGGKKTAKAKAKADAKAKAKADAKAKAKADAKAKAKADAKAKAKADAKAKAKADAKAKAKADAKAKAAKKK